MNKPLLSVVVPVYGTEQYLKKCIDSILAQSYKNIEVIIINDASKGNCKEIAEEYRKADPRVKYVFHEENKGLFQARITGAKYAEGEYIAFADSDDYLSLDFYRPMVEKACRKNYDIVANSTIIREADATFHQYTFHKIALEKQLMGQQVRDTFFGQAGACYAWHTIWNKIYKKSLWDRCLLDFKKLDRHIIMTEDIAFSCILFFQAESFAAVDCGAYYYCRNSWASTNTEKITWQRFQKNVQDMAAVFDFVENTLRAHQASREIMTHVESYRSRYAKMWNNLYTHEFMGSAYDKEAVQLIQCIGDKDILPKRESVGFFEWSKSKLENTLEELREAIFSKKIKVVSFDIFDTLVLRNVWEPEDVFRLMQRPFEEICPAICSYSFLSMRQEAEALCRKELADNCEGWQDVTLSEIYDCLQRLFCLTKEQKNSLRTLEEQTEIRLIGPRRTGKQLLEFAKALGKKVILTSDMYLERPVIEEILKKCGYESYPLYLSSQVRLVKFNEGDLFKYIVKMNQVEPGELLHIGDNWSVDILSGKNNGINTGFLPKTKDVFCNAYKPNSTNCLSSIGNIAGNYMTTWNAMNKFMTHRLMLALVANHFFDNPFVSWNRESDFDANPYYMGYYALGMHLLGVSAWLGELIKAKGADTVCFLARDGYLPKKVFEELQACQGLGSVRTEYVPCSRKALMPWMILNKKGLHNLPVNYGSHSPKSIIRLLNCCCKEVDATKLEGRLRLAGFSYEEKFKEKDEYRSFIHWFSENLYSKQLLEEAKETVRGYYRSKIPQGALVFDLGYSGRIPAALSACLAYPVVYGYVHGEPGSTEHYIRREGLELHTLYDFLPPNRDLVRELFFSEANHQCVGICKKDGQWVAVLENRKVTYSESFVLDRLEKGALKFVREYREAFKGMEECFGINPIISSMPFEGLLAAGNPVDHQVFATTESEDSVYGNLEAISMTDFWNNLPDDSACIRKSYVTGEGGQQLYLMGGGNVNVISRDGAIGKLYRKIDKILPRGSKRRELVRKIANIIISK